MNVQQSSYKGDVSPREAWEMLKDDENAVLIDVRTSPEWGFVGGVDLTSIQKEPILVSWRLFPQMQINERFQEQVLGRISEDKSTPLLFLCRSGARSKEAAMAFAELGYVQCYNVAEGFEGDVDENQHRGVKNGWKGSQLPWMQR